MPEPEVSEILWSRTKRNAVGRMLGRELILMAVLLSMLILPLISGCSKPAAAPGKPRTVQPPGVEISERNTRPRHSWGLFISSVKGRCAKSPGCTLDYEAFHEYDGKAFGVMAIAWKDSEYEIDLYRYDPGKMGWADSPRGESGLSVDVAKTSGMWGVPQSILQKWLKEAEDYMGRKYKSGG